MPRYFNTRRLLLVGMLMLAILLVGFILKNYRFSSPEELLSTLPANIDLAMQRISYTENRDGQPYWSLEADSAAHSLKNGVTSIENVHLTFYQQKGQVDLRAERGEWDSASSTVRVSNDVEIVTSKGDRLQTDSLFYDSSDGTIRSDDKVRLISPGLELTGRGLIYHVDRHVFKLLADVRGKLVNE